MKALILVILLLMASRAPAQIFKGLGRDIKSDAEWKINRKIRNVANQGMDSIANKSKKIIKKKDKKEKAEPSSDEKKTGAPSSEQKVSESDGPQPNQAEGYITLALSTPVTTKGLSVEFSGESIRHDKWKSINLDIKGPGDKETKTVALNDSGLYRIKYDCIEEGDYLITATSSNGKTTATQKLVVLDWSEPNDENAELESAVKEAFDLLKEREETLSGFLTYKHKEELKQKIADTKKKLDALYKLLHSLQTARKEVAKLAAKGQVPSQNIRENLSLLNRSITERTSAIKTVVQAAKHSAPDNTVCEYIVLLNEACAAFSTFSNLTAGNIAKVVTNIVLDKGVPKAVEVANKGHLNSDLEWGAKESSKIYATSKIDAEGLVSKMGKAGFAGDCIQFATDVLLQVYCGVYKGQLTHKYKIYYRNGAETWWSYGVTAEAALTLRYPKTQSGNIIKMKGTIEGNATRFSFFADPEKNPEYHRAGAGKVTTMIVKSYTPMTLPFASALHDALGFGALARAAGTPAYFNIVVDAEYNTETNKIKLFIDDALVDFNDATIRNRQFFIQWVAGLPKLRLMDYPINKARLTINANLKEQNEFTVKKEAGGVLAFTGDVKRKIGTSGDLREHQLELTVSAKKEN